ncbi:MAG: aldo/keto reductase [Spirochaetia bacterium]
MQFTRLGQTDLRVTRTAFGALPIQRLSIDEAVYLLRKAYSGGINFFDTARGYTDSEEKIGLALSDVRDSVIIATKSHGKTGEEVRRDVLTSLEKLKTDYIDLFQFHNPDTIPRPGGADGRYETALELKDEGVIRHIGITNHRLAVAFEAVRSGLFETLQFPLSSLSSDKDLDLVRECAELDAGFIAMKALSGGLITNAATSFAFLRSYENVVPIWGIQRESELNEFIALESNPPELDAEMQELIEKDRRELTGAFCRGCGYCLPCPEGIPINMAARLSLLVARAPYKRFLEQEWIDKMELINNCTECGQCSSQCPYELDTPQLLKEEYGKYREFLAYHNAL